MVFANMIKDDDGVATVPAITEWLRHLVADVPDNAKSKTLKRIQLAARMVEGELGMGVVAEDGEGDK